MSNGQSLADAKLAGSGVNRQPIRYVSIGALFADALHHHRVGRLDQAELLYRQVLAIDARHADSLHLLGVMEHQAGRCISAIEMIGQAIAIAFGRPLYHCSLGNALQDLRRHDEAIASYRAALDLQPDLVEGHFNLGNVFREQGQLEAAAVCYHTALALRPDYHHAYNNLGDTLRRQGKLDEAVGCFQAAIAIQPDYLNALTNLGGTLAEQGRHDEAISCFRRAIELKPDLAEAHSNLGNALRHQGQLDAAVASHRQAVALRPNSAQALGNLANALDQQGETDEAVAHYRRAIELKPDYAEALSNLGGILRKLDHLDEAIACHRRALGLKPDLAESHSSLGSALRQQGHIDEAVASHRRAIALQPASAEAHTNLALALLARGDLREGWQENEWRWKTVQLVTECRDFAQPMWRGEPTAGQTLLIHHEQGFGDTIQFCRYAPLAAARGLRIILLAPRPLVRLLRTLPDVDQVLAEGDALPPFDLHCPMLSLPAAFGTTLETVPAPKAYLSAEAGPAAVWRDRLAAMPDSGVRVGLVWAGNPRAHSLLLMLTDRRRSLPPALLAPLFDVPGCQFFSLQKTGPKAPERFRLNDSMDQMADFADTAALIANLDLVISVDTAVAHLAAALGKPVWLLERFDSCWRWLNGRRDSPWYPSVRLYRQTTPGAWESVLAEVTRDLLSFPARNLT